MTARILIVDDVVADTGLLEAKLSAEYYQVATAHDGSAAIELSRAWQPDLVLLDDVMRGMDGYETCRKLKADPATLHIPVMMVTRRGETAERLRGLQSGADDFLTRPVEPEMLMTRVRSLVRLKRMLDEWRARGETARGLGLTGLSAGEPPVAGARALVIENADCAADAVQQALLREGILPGRAHDEAEALALTAAVPFDLIVVGLSMHEAEPLRLASRLREAEATHDTPMLLIAQPEQRSRILRGFDLGANDWLLRPVDENELRVRARNQIRRKFYRERLRADLGQAIELALTDPMTGLYNQRYLLRHLRGLLASSHASGVAVLMIDVDHFKAVNDRYGHAAGDGALKRIADTLRVRTRVFDSVARYGGEEFVIVMPGAAAPDGLAAAERVRLAIEEMAFQPEAGTRHRLTVSIGIACADPAAPAMTAEALMQQADRAMYRAKRAGRNRVELAAV